MMTTRDEILTMAKKLGHFSGQTVEMNDVGLEQFFRLAQAAAYERAADLCATMYPGGYHPTLRQAAARCADSILALKEQA